MNIKNKKCIELTKTKTIMEHTQDHAKHEPKKKDLIAKIIHVRLWKIAALPCENLGLDCTKIN